MSDDIPTDLEQPGQQSTRGLAGAAALMMMATLLSAITGLIRASALTWHYGDTPDLNAYFQAFRIPDFVYFLVAGGAMRTGFVPIFSEYLARGDRERAWRTFSNTLWILALVATVVVALGMVFARPLTVLVAPGWRGPEYRSLFDLTTTLMRIMFPAEIFMLLGGLLMGALNAHKHFLMPALGPICYNLLIIAAALVSPRLWGLKTVALAVPLAALLCDVLLQTPALRRRGARLLAVLDFHDEGFRRVLSLAVPVIFGLAIAEIITVFTSSLATWVDPANGSTAFELANRLWKFPTRFIGAGIAIAVFAYLADHYARDDHKGFRRDFSFGMRSTLFLSVPPALIMLILREPIIRLLYPGLSPERIAVTGEALFWYSLGIVPLSLVYILARAFYARHDTLTAVWVGGTSVVVCALVAVPLGLAMGVGGLALATSVANLANAGLLAWLLQRRVGGLDGRRIWNSVVRQAVPVVGFGVVCWLTLGLTVGYLGMTGVQAKLVNVFVPMAVATVVFVLLAWLFRVEELNSAWNLLIRKQARNR